MIRAFFDDERSTTLRWCDVLAQVATVDGFPNLVGQQVGLLIVEFGEASEETLRVLEHRATQGMKTFDEPRFDESLLGIQVDGEIEVVTDELVCT